MLAMLLSPVSAVAGVPAVLRPDPERARAWLERELSRPEYQQSLRERFLAWLSDLWNGLRVGALGASPLSTAAVVVVVVVLVVVVALLVTRVRPEARQRREAGPLLADRETSPDAHRAAAERALAASDPDLAVVEAFRALATRAVGRGLVLARPGLTADELAVDLAPLFPSHADDLRGAANRFDQVFYGHLSATDRDAHAVLALDDALRRQRPTAPDDTTASTASAVPR
jgi:hypothetical protein